MRRLDSSRCRRRLRGLTRRRRLCGDGLRVRQLRRLGLLRLGDGLRMRNLCLGQLRARRVRVSTCRRRVRPRALGLGAGCLRGFGDRHVLCARLGGGGGGGVNDLLFLHRH